MPACANGKPSASSYRFCLIATAGSSAGISFIGVSEADWEVLDPKRHSSPYRLQWRLSTPIYPTSIIGVRLADDRSESSCFYGIVAGSKRRGHRPAMREAI
jgi:hypothetical protein